MRRVFGWLCVATALAAVEDAIRDALAREAATDYSKAELEAAIALLDAEAAVGDRQGHVDEAPPVDEAPRPRPTPDASTAEARGRRGARWSLAGVDASRFNATAIAAAAKPRYLCRSL